MAASNSAWPRRLSLATSLIAALAWFSQTILAFYAEITRRAVASLVNRPWAASPHARFDARYVVVAVSAAIAVLAGTATRRGGGRRIIGVWGVAGTLAAAVAATVTVVG